MIAYNKLVVIKMKVNYSEIFEQYGGIMRTSELKNEGITYKKIQELIAGGEVEKIKYGYYQWQDEKAFSEASVLASLFPEAIICDLSAAMYYGYTDRTIGTWHVAVDSKSARNKFKMDFPIIKPHFIQSDRLQIGKSKGDIDGVSVNIYNRERVICDCLRHMNSMDGEIYSTIIKRYVDDHEKNPARLMQYAIVLGVEKKARMVIGIWL